MKANSSEIFGDAKYKPIKIEKIGKSTLLLAANTMNPEIKHIIPFVDQELLIDGSMAAEELEITYRDAKESILETAIQIDLFRR